MKTEKANSNKRDQVDKYKKEMNRRILLVSVFLKTEGGITRFAKDLLSVEMNREIRLFDIGRPPKNYKTASKGEDFKIISPGLKRTIVGALITLYHIVKFPYVLLRFKPAIVHINSTTFAPFWESVVYLIISKIFKIKVLYHQLSAFDIFYKKSGLLTQYLMRILLKKADAHIVLSKKVSDIITEFILPDQMFVIPSNVDISLFPTAYEKKQDSNNEIDVLFIGGAYPFRKGVFDILKAIPLVIKKNPYVKFSFVGGDNTKSVIPQCKEMGVFEYINFLGFVSEGKKNMLYASSDMLILPSYNEGLPYVIIEALASGLPIISTYIGGIPEAVEDGVNGFLITPGDYKLLAEKILLLSSDQGLRERIGKANIDKAEVQYNKRIAMKKIQQIYDILSPA